MTTKTKLFTFEKYAPEQQGIGSFDGGKITEIKPIPFPQERGGSERVGPLLYWAWASANGDGVIGMHPHKGFEIVSYVLKGGVGHTDSAGNNRRVNEGGTQIMQTGSGISHQEEMYGERTDFFQIWFEPNLEESIKQEAVYKDFEAKDFPISNLDTGVALKRIIGPHGAAQLQAPIEWDEIIMEEKSRFTLELKAGSLAAMMIISGSAKATIDETKESLDTRDFALIKTESSHTLLLNSESEDTRIALITAPLDPGYPLYRF